MHAWYYILLVHVVGIGLDIWLAVNETPNYVDTISAKMKYVYAHAPVWLYAMAMLLGHFGLNHDWNVVGPRTGIALLCLTGLAFLAAGFWLRGGTITRAEIFWTNFIAIYTGPIAGMLFWPQRPLDDLSPLL